MTQSIKNTMKSFIVALLGLIAFTYVLNPTLGLFEIIPDALPFVGNLDEGAAVALIIMCLRYFGVDVTRIFERKKENEQPVQP